jgi:hypothetical protein
MTLDVENRFDGEIVWAGLTDMEQAAIGAIALELVAAWYCSENSGDDETEQTPLSRAADAADFHLLESLRQTFVDAVPRTVLDNLDGQPLLPSKLGPVCRECGCSGDDACDVGCGWHEPSLCTACA